MNDYCSDIDSGLKKKNENNDDVETGRELLSAEK